MARNLPQEAPKLPEPINDVPLSSQESFERYGFATARCDVCSILPKQQRCEWSVRKPDNWKPGQQVPFQCPRCGGLVIL